MEGGAEVLTGSLEGKLFCQPQPAINVLVISVCAWPSLFSRMDDKDSHSNPSQLCSLSHYRVGRGWGGRGAGLACCARSTDNKIKAQRSRAAKVTQQYRWGAEIRDQVPSARWWPGDAATWSSGLLPQLVSDPRPPLTCIPMAGLHVVPPLFLPL